MHYSYYKHLFADFLRPIIMNHTLKKFTRENISFFVISILVLVFIVALLVEFSNSSSTCKYERNDTKQYFCYLNLSVQKQNVNICNNLPGNDKNGCIQYYAIQARDFTPCTLISDAGSEDFCYANVAFAKRDSELCADVKTASYRDECYERFAIAERDRAFCTLLGNESGKASCVSEVQRSIGEQKR